MDHDHNFKNLILDYPRQALEFLAADEAASIDSNARIVPIRQEQLKKGLGERFRELDIPLLVEWPDGRREALLFVVEEESQAKRFNIHRLAHYCLDLAEHFETQRVVPVVVFLRGTAAPRDLVLGGDRHRYLTFDYIACELTSLRADAYRDSNNLVARLNLPNMACQNTEEKLAAFAAAVRGLQDLEADPERRLKYADFIDIYARLSSDERREYARQYPQEDEAMVGMIEQSRQQDLEQGLEQGREQGLQQGEASVLIRLMERKFGSLTTDQRQRIEAADADTLLAWSERILTASSADEVFNSVDSA